MEKISEATLKRLPTYLSYLKALPSGGFGEHFGDGACRGSAYGRGAGAQGSGAGIRRGQTENRLQPRTPDCGY